MSGAGGIGHRVDGWLGRGASVACRSRVGCLLAALVALALPRSLRAQTVLGVSDLSFPRVIAGVPTQIQPSDPTAAKFQVTPKTGKKTLILVFALPASVTGAPGTLPLSFGVTSAAWSTTNQASSATVFNPAQGITLSVKSTQTVYVWVGGTARPSALQPAGDYTVGTIGLTATAQ